MMVVRHSLTVTFSLCVMAGCGGGSSGPIDGGGGAADAAPTDGGGCGRAQGGEAANGDLDGTWGRVQITRVRVNGLSGRQTARNVYLNEITQNGDQLTITERMCELKIDEDEGLIQTRVLPSFYEGLPDEARTGTIVSDGAGGFTFTLDEDWTTRGITLENIETDPLPEDPADPRIGDWDQDQHVGMTLLLSGLLSGEAYVIQRDWNILAGPQVDVDVIEGGVEFGTEQIYLGSDPAIIAEFGYTVSPDPDPSVHYFQQVRIPDGSDCAWLVENQCTLFDL
jgi:hypothetical protein